MRLVAALAAPAIPSWPTLDAVTVLGVAAVEPASVTVLVSLSVSAAACLTFVTCAQVRHPSEAVQAKQHSER